MYQLKGELTLLRQALVNNKFFALLAVKHNFIKYLKYENKEIFNKISAFSNLYETEAFDFDNFDDETPKLFADTFESVAGAIYLDSGCSLEAVWKVYFPILKPYLGKISLGLIKHKL